jgi:hypothetical protein
MRRAMIVAAIVLAIPLATLIYLKLFNGKVVIVRNAGPEHIEVTLTITNGDAVERTAPRAIGADRLSWIVFYPRTKGQLVLRCMSASHLARVSLGAGGQGGVSLSNLTLDGCSHVASRSSVAF